jgi:hypothetical protein
MSITPKMNKDSIEFIRSEIAKKMGSEPYRANDKTVTHIVTDMDHHPYTRWFRGVYYHPQPIVFEREAGWRRVKNDCYNVHTDMTGNEDPSHCFETSCSTTRPCFLQNSTNFSEKMKVDTALDNMCVIQNR